MAEKQGTPQFVLGRREEDVDTAGRVKSELFVGREQELALFQEMLSPEAEIDLFNLHTDGDGGIGKTQLLLRMQAQCASQPGKVVFSKSLIDFYNTGIRSKLGVMQEIVSNMGSANFPEFQKLVQRYHETVDVSERTGLLARLEKTFGQDYVGFSEQVKAKGQVIVLFFDTYEFIQRIDDELRQAGPTEFSRWLETQFFPAIQANTRLIVSGRYPLQDVDRDRLSVKELNLSHFAFDDTKAFWKQCFQLTNDEELAEKVGSDTLIETFHALAEGRPILLALFADWLEYERNPLSPQQLLDEIEQQTGTLVLPFTDEQRALFENVLIKRIESLETPEDRAVTSMAVAHRRMTPNMFSFLTKHEFSLEECRETLLEKLRPLSFIKYKSGDIVLLHDEMRRLVIQHYWNDHDAARNIRQEIAGETVRYYDETFLATEVLSATERETYISELLEYAFFADSKEGIARFCHEFDVALEDGRYDYGNLLLREAEGYLRENPRDIAFPELLEITLRRIQYSIQVEGKYADALKMVQRVFEEYEGDPAWETSVVRGHFLRSRGEIEYFSGDRERVISSFQKAKSVFYDFGEDIWLNRTNNWIGLAYYSQGNFAEAKAWWLKGQKGFSELLERKELDERERRRLLQGVRYVFSNLAFVDNYTGRFDLSVRHAEIALDIVQHVLQNNRELARMQIVTSEMLTFAGRTVDARHHAFVAETRLERIHDPLWLGRLKTNLCLLQYRNEQLAYLLEYYRAEEIEDVVAQLGFIQRSDIDAAKALIEAALVTLSDGSFEITDQTLAQWKTHDIPETILESLADLNHQEFARKHEFLAAVEDRIGAEQTALYTPSLVRYALKKPASPKHLADACYALGELCLVTPSPTHWHDAEEAFLEALKWGRQNKFLYQIIDTLESLVTLYYFWNGASGISGELKFQNREAMRKYQQEIERYDDARYPNLFGKYRVTCGDDRFDIGLHLLIDKQEKDRHTIMPVFQEAFTQYVRAAELMRMFNPDRYYLTLRVFYNRLNTLLVALQQQHVALGWMNDLKAVWEDKHEVFKEIFTHVHLRIKPEERLHEIERLQGRLQDVLLTGDFGLALLFNDCLIGAYHTLAALKQENEEYRERLIRRLNAQAGLYRTLGDDYQATRCVADAKQEVAHITDAQLREGLSGCIDASEGALKYRKGEYGRLLEFFLRGELSAARRRFDRQFPGDREDALRLLKRGEQKLIPVIASWMRTWKSLPANEEKSRLARLIQRHRQSLGEARFRIGELLMLSEEFIDQDGQKGAFRYLANALRDAQKSGDAYRYDNAVESYVNALYFSGNYDHPTYRQQRLMYEEQLVEKLTSPEETIHTSIMSRLRIVQGDALFSSCFQRQEDPTGGYKYVPLKKPIPIRPLRTMLRYYVEACNFMAQHSATNFAATVRFVQRRIELIADRECLQLIQRGLRDVWSDQESLREKTDELETLVQFAKIRSMMVSDDN